MLAAAEDHITIFQSIIARESVMKSSPISSSMEVLNYLMSKYLALLAKPPPLRKLRASMMFHACTEYRKRKAATDPETGPRTAGEEKFW